MVATSRLGRLESRRARARVRRWSGVLALASCIAAGATGPARAAITDPDLALTAAHVEVGATVRVVSLEGLFPVEDQVQLPVPLQILVRSGTQYVRYDAADGVFTGVAPELADGLQAGEVPGLLAQGAPAAQARVLLLVPGRIDVLLPPSFPSGSAEVQLFVLDEDEGILSNALGVEIGEVLP